jgi:cyclophilin family peptidyl-prolyl cis-trans isomerase
MKRTIFFILIAASLYAQTPAPTADAASAATAPQREPGLYATIRTSQGDIFVKLFETEAPITVQNFVDLARGTRAWKDPKTGQMVKRPLYPGTIFHRVIKGFMIQGGDPTGTGMGEIGYTIPEEFVPTLKFDQPGRLGMAKASAPHTGSSQFFITEVPTPHLDGLHTVFGQVVEGQDVVNKIAHLPTGPNDKPVTPVRLTAIIFKREGPVPPGGVVMRGITPAKKAPPAKKSPPAAKQ